MSGAYKKYLIFIYYGSEGWSIMGQADDKKSAIDVYKECHGMGQYALLVENKEIAMVDMPPAPDPKLPIDGEGK